MLLYRQTGGGQRKPSSSNVRFQIGFHTLKCHSQKGGGQRLGWTEKRSNTANGQPDAEWPLHPRAGRRGCSGSRRRRCTAHTGINAHVVADLARCGSLTPPQRGIKEEPASSTRRLHHAGLKRPDQSVWDITMSRVSCCAGAACRGHTLKK